MIDKEVLEAEDVATILGIKKQTVYKLIREKKIPAQAIGDKRVRVSRKALMDWLYFGSLTNQKAIMGHIGVDFDEMMKWIMAFRNYRDLSETALLESAKVALEELRKVYINRNVEPDADVIKHFEAAIGKVEVFDPGAILQRTAS